METGIVKWFNDLLGFGVIAPDNGSEDLYAYFYTANLNGFKSIREGEKVTYEVVQGSNSKQASNVQRAL